VGLFKLAGTRIAGIGKSARFVAEELTLRNGAWRRSLKRCSCRAASSFPVPLSPVMRTGTSMRAAFRNCSAMRRMDGDSPRSGPLTWFSVMSCMPITSSVLALVQVRGQTGEEEGRLSAPAHKRAALQPSCERPEFAAGCSSGMEHCKLPQTAQAFAYSLCKAAAQHGQNRGKGASSLAIRVLDAGCSRLCRDGR
jgi:hypothetical protein